MSRTAYHGAVSVRITACLFVSLCCAQGHARETWWHTSWQYRLWFEVPPGRSGLPGDDLAVAEFFSGGRLKRDASDLRVVIDGTPVPHRVLVGSPSDDFFRIAFELPGKGGRAAVYFGNAKANALTRKLSVKRGCLLETYQYRGGSPDNVEMMRDVLKRAESAPYGAGYVPNIYHGLNPFGPTENFVSRYTGWIVCPGSGTYIFCTSSDDASFLFVDDELIVQWPGWHGAIPDVRFQKKAELTKGLHKIEYLHVNGSGPTIAVAAWQTPEQSRIVPIPAQAFAPVVRCSPLRIEKLGGTTAPQFHADVVGECFFEDKVAFRVRFRNQSGDASSNGSVGWDFGDGTSATGHVVEHVYLKAGTYSVTLSVGGAGSARTVTNRVRVDRRWEAQADRETDQPKRIAKLVSDYDLTRMDSSALESLALLHKSVGNEAAEQRVLEAVVSRPAEVPDDVYFEAVVFLVHRWRERTDNRARALRLLDRAESHLSQNANLRARVIRERGDLLFYFSGELDEALGEYDKVVGRFADKLEDHIVRITKIRIGDVYRKKGDLQKARTAYIEAEKFRIHGIQGDPSVRRGALLQAATWAITVRKTEEAEDALSALEWEFPADKLTGQLSLLRAKAALLNEDTAEALVQLDDLVRVAPESNEAAEALYIAAEIDRSLGRTAEAIGRYERIVKEYRDSPRASDAQSRLKGATPPDEKR